MPVTSLQGKTAPGSAKALHHREDRREGFRSGAQRPSRPPAAPGKRMARPRRQVRSREEVPAASLLPRRVKAAQTGGEPAARSGFRRAAPRRAGPPSTASSGKDPARLGLCLPLSPQPARPGAGMTRAGLRRSSAPGRLLETPQGVGPAEPGLEGPLEPGLPQGAAGMRQRADSRAPFASRRPRPKASLGDRARPKARPPPRWPCLAALPEGREQGGEPRLVPPGPPVGRRGPRGAAQRPGGRGLGRTPRRERALGRRPEAEARPTVHRRRSRRTRPPAPEPNRATLR